MQKTLIALSALVILSINSSLLAQENSPYTRYGLGNYNTGAFANQLSIGGLYSAISSPVSLNYQNPAALGKLSTTSFEVDALGSRTWEKAKDSASVGFGNGSPRAIVLGLPIRRYKWGAAIGVEPSSNTNYNIYQLAPYNYKNTSSSVAQQQTGTGGTYRFFMAHGFRLKLDTFNSLFLGARLDYMFGNMNSNDLLIFPDSFNAYSTRHRVYNNMSGFVAGGGFQYETHLNKHTLILGGNVTLPSNIQVSQYSQWDRFVGTGGIRDTIYTNKASGTMHVPLMYAFGITWAYTPKDAAHRFRDYNKWTVGVQYESVQWKDYRFMGSPDSLVNSWKLSVGAEYVPDFTSIDNYWARVKYRLGSYMAQMPQYLNQTKLNSYAITAGMGLPLVGRFSEISLGFEVGTQGTLKNNLIQENFVRLHIGLTFNDNSWFKPRKFE